MIKKQIEDSRNRGTDLELKENIKKKNPHEKKEQSISQARNLEIKIQVLSKDNPITSLYSFGELLG